jgi:hypothetical protein
MPPPKSRGRRSTLDGKSASRVSNSLIPQPTNVKDGPRRAVLVHAFQDQGVLSPYKQQTRQDQDRKVGSKTWKRDHNVLRWSLGCHSVFDSPALEDRRWIGVLSEPTKQIIWKKNRNAHAYALLHMLDRLFQDVLDSLMSGCQCV